MVTVIYCFDAYCGWCFAFTKVIQKLEEELHRNFQFEVLSGGMILPENQVHISTIAPYLKENSAKVSVETGVVFGKDFLWHVNHPQESDWFPNSEKPAIALCILKEYLPEKQLEFASDIQTALFLEGRDLCDDEAYRHLLYKYGVPAEDFYTRLHDESYKERAYEEFALVKQLKVKGYPCVMMQLNALKFYLVSNGYADYTTVLKSIRSIYKENF
jgi:putative protein-disulfide isomerase